MSLSEETVQNNLRLALANLGWDFWRNNVGAMIDAKGRAVRFGLANDSAAMNREIKSSDLIGIVPITVTPDLIGKRLGIFTALEVKHSDWKFSPTDAHSVAQAKFHEIVRRAGGLAGFVAVPERDLWPIIMGEK